MCQKVHHQNENSTSKTVIYRTDNKKDQVINSNLHDSDGSKPRCMREKSDGGTASKNQENAVRAEQKAPPPSPLPPFLHIMGLSRYRQQANFIVSDYHDDI